RTHPPLSFAGDDAAGAALPDTTIYIDGALTVARLDDGKAHDVDPGAHTIKFIHGAKEQVVTIVVNAGEKGRTVTAAFNDIGVPVAAATAAKEPAAPPKTRGPKVSHPFGA